MPCLLCLLSNQGCVQDYYPFDFLGTYFDQLEKAQTSIDQLIKTLNGNLDFVQKECGTDGFAPFLILAKSMNKNLELLKETVDEALSLVNCEDINRMYVNAVHDAGCTKSPNALAWVYGSLLVISVCGMIMITLRASYLPSVYVETQEIFAQGDDPIAKHDNQTVISQQGESSDKIDELEDDMNDELRDETRWCPSDDCDVTGRFESEQPVVTVHRHRTYNMCVTPSAPPVETVHQYTDSIYVEPSAQLMNMEAVRVRPKCT